MSSDKFYLTREEQAFLMEMLEINNPEQAVEKFADLLISEHANVSKLTDYLKKIMKRLK
jgi:hypothetical protein